MQLYRLPPRNTCGSIATVLEKRAFMESMGRAGNSVKDYFSNARFDDPNDIGRTALIGALGGAATGGIANAAGRVGLPDEEKAKKRSILGSMLTGGLLGAGAGASMPMLAQMARQMGGGNKPTNIDVSVNAAAAGGKGGEGGAGGAGGGAAAPAAAAARNFEHTPDGKDITDKVTREQMLGLLKKETPMRDTGWVSALAGALVPGGLGNLASVANANPGMVGAGTTIDEKAKLMGPGLLAALGTAAVAVPALKGRGVRNLSEFLKELVSDKKLRRGVGILGGANVGANLLGRGMFGADQDEKYVDAVKKLVPASFWQNKHIPSIMKMPLMENDASKLREGLENLKRTLPEKYLPETQPMLEQL